VVALGAATSVDRLAAQAAEFRPAVVALADEGLAPRLKDLLPAGIELRAGADALASIATLAEVAVNGVVGFRRAPRHAGRPGRGRRWAWPTRNR